MKLTNNFYLYEFTKSQTALRHGIDNTPTQTEIDNLKLLCREVLQPLRYAFDMPITISSGFRCLELNKKIGSSDRSQHVTGHAADFEIPGIPNLGVAEFIRDNFSFDQLILEYWYSDVPNSGWIHCSYVSLEDNRKDVLTINKNGVYTGFRSM